MSDIISIKLPRKIIKKSAFRYINNCLSPKFQNSKTQLTRFKQKSNRNYVVGWDQNFGNAFCRK